MCFGTEAIQIHFVTTSKWLYEARSCFKGFRDEFPGVAVLEYIFFKSLNYVMKLFLETGSIKRKSGSRTLTKQTPDPVENVRQVMDDNPHTSLRRVYQQVDLSFSTCSTT